MSVDFPTDDELHNEACRFMTQNPSADIHDARRYAHTNFFEHDARRFASAFFQIQLQRAAIERDCERIWPESKRYG
jgi:hypothetical protein